MVDLVTEMDLPEGSTTVGGKTAQDRRLEAALQGLSQRTLLATGACKEVNSAEKS